MKVLVTGATGFVGSWLVRRLVQENLTVRILRRKSSTTDLSDTNVQVFLGDVTDPESLLNACRDVHTVFHLAGVVGYSRTQRRLMEAVNVGGTQNVIAAACAAKVTRIIHMSSVVAVGASFDGKVPLNEQSPFNLHHLNLGYFETKWQAEQLVLRAVNDGLIDAVILNPSTIYGRGDAQKGSRGIQLKVAQGKFPFFTSGGVSVIAIEDVIDAVMTAWRQAPSGERYILSGENLTIKDLFATIAECAGTSPPSIHLPDPVVKLVGRVGDGLERLGKKGPLNSESAWTALLYHWFDNHKATKALGLKVRPARWAIANSVEWIKERGLI